MQSASDVCRCKKFKSCQQLSSLRSNTSRVNAFTSYAKRLLLNHHYRLSLSASQKCSIYKCIGDDTKAAARQSLNCIKNKKNKIWRKMIFNMADGILTPCNVAFGMWQWIHQVAAPCNVIRGSGMTCHWIRQNVRHIGILHLVSVSTHYRSRHVILYQSAKFYSNRTTLGRKNDVMSIFKMACLSHLGLYRSNNGFFEKPMYDLQ